MNLRLTPHSGSKADSGYALGVDAFRPAATALGLRYRLSGGVGALLVPAAGKPKRTDGLWRHTCFEAFLRVGGSAAYVEINLAPSTEWQAYRFEGYRSAMSEAELPPPRIEMSIVHDEVELRAEILGLPDGPWSLNLAAVIEEADGRLSYWALAHPPGAPDFHHPDCFALHLPPPA
jgi:hypothetical protein